MKRVAATSRPAAEVDPPDLVTTYEDVLSDLLRLIGSSDVDGHTGAWSGVAPDTGNVGLPLQDHVAGEDVGHSELRLTIGTACREEKIRWSALVLVRRTVVKRCQEKDK